MESLYSEVDDALASVICIYIYSFLLITGFGGDDFPRTLFSLSWL